MVETISQHYISLLLFNRNIIEIAEKIMYKQLPTKVPVILTDEEYSTLKTFFFMPQDEIKYCIYES